jgi:predicted ribosome quality control (RQC) complex YloA/Tae2 family protein
MGPELVISQSAEITGLFSQNKIRQAESGDSWLVLFFSRGRPLFFSWDSEFYGCCEAEPGEIRALVELASSRPPLQSAIKSHLSGSELLEASALNNDRVLEITFRREVGAGFSQTRYISFEASGRYSNLILLDGEKRIIEAAKHIHPQTNRYRSIIPGRPYTPPPPVNGVPIEKFSGGIDEIDNVAGMGRPLIAAIKKNFKESGKSRHIPGILPMDAVYQRIGPYVTLYPELLGEAEPIEASSALAAARECVILPLLTRHAEREKKKTAARLGHLLKTNSKKIAEAEKLIENVPMTERFMLYGKLILENCWRIPLRTAEVCLSEWTDTGEVSHTIALDPKKDAPQNAEQYFAKYKKKRAAALRAKKMLPGLYLERDGLMEQSALLDCSTDALTISMMLDELSSGKNIKKDTRPKHNKTVPPHRHYELKLDGETAGSLFVGLSARGNNYVTFTIAKGDDIWLHAKNVPGAHVILRLKANTGEHQRYRVIEIAAAAAAYFSKSRESGRERVDYTERKHVRAITGAGLAQVTYSGFSTVYADVSVWLSEGLMIKGLNAVSANKSAFS